MSSTGLPSTSRKSRYSAFTLVEIMIAVSIIGLLASMAIYNFVQARDHGRIKMIMTNVRVLENAKEMWAFEAKKGEGAVPVEADVTPFLKQNKMPNTVIGETYVLNALGEHAEAKTPIKVGEYNPGDSIRP
jgi:prepilin-type N-terminal cleavage/methylation domain-containing protein